MLDLVESPATPVETVTDIKPSEALRLGRLVRPKRRAASWFWGKHAACALGAIHIGWGGDPDDKESLHATSERLRAMLGDESPDFAIGGTFDYAQQRRQNGDEAVLKFLEEKGL